MPITAEAVAARRRAWVPMDAKCATKLAGVIFEKIVSGAAAQAPVFSEQAQRYVEAYLATTKEFFAEFQRFQRLSKIDPHYHSAAVVEKKRILAVKLRDRINAINDVSMNMMGHVTAYLRAVVSARVIAPVSLGGSAKRLQAIRADLINLSRSYTTEYSASLNCLRVTTPPIELHGVRLGKYNVVFNLDAPLPAASPPPDHFLQFRVEATDTTKACPSDPDTIHPHVSHNKLCEGDGRPRINVTLREGMFGATFQIILTILRTYNANSPHQSLEVWIDKLETQRRETYSTFDSTELTNARARVTAGQDHTNSDGTTVAFGTWESNRRLRDINAEMSAVSVLALAGGGFSDERTGDPGPGSVQSGFVDEHAVRQRPNSSRLVLVNNAPTQVQIPGQELRWCVGCNAFVRGASSCVCGEYFCAEHNKRCAKCETPVCITCVIRTDCPVCSAAAQTSANSAQAASPA